MNPNISDDQNLISSQLVQLIRSIEASGIAILPSSNDELLKSIVEAAARIFNAAAASILLIDFKEKVLVFKVSCGASDHDLIGMKFPLEKGIAGYVAMSGQPIAIANVRQDARFNQDFAKSTGYIPTSILAVPLKAGERVIGVMEVLDKKGAESFGIQDMDLLAMFARQAALAIDQSQKVDWVNDAMLIGLKRLVRSTEQENMAALAGVLDEAIGENSSTQILALAELFQEISGLGMSEQKACTQILKVFAEYHRAKRWNRK